MNANLFVIERPKVNGYYKNSSKNKCIGTFCGGLAYNHIMSEVEYNFTVEGCAVLSHGEKKWKPIADEAEYSAYCKENQDAAKKGFLGKNLFVYRVEQAFFDALMDREKYKRWSNFYKMPGEVEWHRRHLKDFEKVIPYLNFDKNYYYISEFV